MLSLFLVFISRIHSKRGYCSFTTVSNLPPPKPSTTHIHLGMHTPTYTQTNKQSTHTHTQIKAFYAGWQLTNNSWILLQKNPVIHLCVTCLFSDTFADSTYPSLTALRQLWQEKLPKLLKVQHYSRKDQSKHCFFLPSFGRRLSINKYTNQRQVAHFWL